jgi:Domain of unknown function (DUF4124)
MKCFWCAAALILLILAGPASAQFYKYVDGQGHVKFTDDINQVPEGQRAAVRSYAESVAKAPAVAESSGTAEKSASVPGVSAASQLSEAAAEGDGDSMGEAKTRLEEAKKKLDVEYQALVKEQEAITKDRETLKTREEISNHNKRVEAFNQRAAKYETGSNELRKEAETYNARVMENEKMVKPAK